MGRIARSGGGGEALAGKVAGRVADLGLGFGEDHGIGSLERVPMTR